MSSTDAARSPDPRLPSPPDEAGRGGARRAVALLPPALSIAVHHGILAGFFTKDDFLHLFRIANFGFADFALQPYGGHLLLVPNVVFTLNHALFGLDPRFYFGLVLATHALNAWLLFDVVRRVAGRPHLAAFLASFWGMSPLAQGSLSWYSVYGHVLAATLLLWLLRDAVRTAASGAPPSRATLARWVALLLALATCFGVGVAAATFSFVWLPLLLPAPDRRRAALPLAALAIAMPALYVGLHAVAPPLGNVPQTLEILALALQPERWGIALALLRDLLSYGAAALALGPLIAADAEGVAVGPFAGASTAAAMQLSRALFALAALGLAWALWHARGAARARLIGFAWLALSCYGLVALGRATVFDATQRPIFQGATEPRYHYVGPLLLALTAAAAWPRARRPAVRRLASALAAVWIAAAFGLYARAARELDFPSRADGREEWGRVRAAIRDAIDRAPPGADVFIRNRRFRSAGWVAKYDFFPGWAGVFVLAYPENAVDGRRVYFVESDPETLRTARRRPDSRTASLLVPPGSRAR